MNQYKLVTFFLAVLVAFCLVGVGVFIGLKSAIGIIGCLVLATCLMGFGFSYKKKHLRP
ncbi:DUF5325 family protein [Brevibacillus laterosporus]|uniref:Membrane protein n=2 Tax=Brevibacillus TaxID=55080 RepID=A0A0F7BYV7_BRELA|nr:MULTISPECIES: DUF5325 family protein [Brevibacillus]AKF93152.1 membrane protein [Brevibacillus laterosporus]MCR8986552.1 YlaF family protein [Brevibacillus laterosporus]MCZ0832287.1 DUF5325 family protein [Brevibacillus halotolerans]GIO03654.1 hypothetical protein J5TS2_43220 [Brevibacillus halotolerans]